jgi:hypothetical protein
MLLGLLVSEDDGSKFLPNVRTYSTNDTQNVPEDLHYQQYACENLNSQVKKGFFILPKFLHSCHNKT